MFSLYPCHYFCLQIDTIGRISTSAFFNPKASHIYTYVSSIKHANQLYVCTYHRPSMHRKICMSLYVHLKHTVLYYLKDIFNQIHHYIKTNEVLGLLIYEGSRFQFHGQRTIFKIEVDKPNSLGGLQLDWKCQLGINTLSRLFNKENIIARKIHVLFVILYNTKKHTLLF